MAHQSVGQGGSIVLDATYQDGTGTLVDPVTPLVDVLNPSGVAVVVDAVPVKVGVGLYTYTFAVPANAPLGTWTAHWTGSINGVAVAGDDTFTVLAAGSVSFPPGDSWITAAQLTTACPGIAAAVDEDQIIEVSSELLYVLSGRKFGTRTDVVRPHRAVATCGCPPLLSCSCCTPELVLASPVQSITEVRIDNVVLDPSAYALFDRRRLIRVDGKMWPCCQNLAWPLTAAGTWQVTYTYGEDVPASGIAAVKELACQMALAGSGSADCRLPQRVQSVVRQGVSMVLLDPQEFLSSGRTGLYLVDLFLSAHNPAGARRRATVHSPDLPIGARNA